MRVFITGVSGFLGSRLACHLINAGNEVLGSGASESSRARAPRGLEQFIVRRLGDDLNLKALGEIDAIIHAAYDRSPEARSQNLKGTLEWYDTAEHHGVPKQLFISSDSAQNNARSSYGILKHRLEEHFLEREQSVVRPGLVIGNGGLFRRMMDLVWGLPMVPLLDGGKNTALVTSPDDLAASVAKLLDGAAALEVSRCVDLFNHEAVPLVDLLRSLKSKLGRRVPLVSVPSAILLPPLRLARGLGIRLPIDEENVRGYRNNHRVVRQTDYPTVLGRETPLDVMLTTATEEFLAEQKAHKE